MPCKMEDTDAATGPEAVIESLDACLALAGRDSWTAPFVSLVAGLGAAQVMVFAYTPDAATCLLSRNFRSRALGTELGEEYLRGWFRQDPLFATILELPQGQLRRVISAEYADAMQPDYRTRFFDRPGFGGKTAILAAGARLRIAVNLYRPPDGAAAQSHGLERLLGRIALLHFEARPEHDYPAPLSVLSARERAVCLGILSGKKAEQIALDLELATTTVVTYRSRAYEKLGISSRGALFAICRR